MKIKLSENLCRPEDAQCLTETNETLYCIVAKTFDGKTKFYKDGAFIDDYTKCTTFNDLDEARAEWFDIDKSKYRRVFVPIYDPESFKQHLTESKEATRDIILEIVQGEFETGHNIADSKEEFFKMMKDEGIRPSARMWDFYNECHNLGPAGFYDEYKDVLDFDPMFVSEYGTDTSEENTVESAQGFNLYDKVKVKRFNIIGTIIDLLDYDGRIIAVVKEDDSTGWSDPRRFDLDELEHVISESAELKRYEAEREQELGYKTCDNCGTRLNDGGTCPKCDEGEEDYGDELNEKLNVNESASGKYVAQKCESDFAEEIALMAMRAMRLREHEADTLQKDLEDGLATNWVSAFEKLPDSSDVKKLFFQFAVKANDGLTESAELTNREKLQRYFERIGTPLSLEESKESKTCCICKEPIKGYGNNAEPVCSGTCCDKCNMDVVLPARVKALRNSKNEELDDDIDESLNGDIGKQLTDGVSKGSLIRWLKDHAEQDVSTEDFNTLVDNLWSAIEKENAERKYYKMGYKSIEEVDVPQLIDSSDNPVHDIGYKLLGWSDYDDNIDEKLTEGNKATVYLPDSIDMMLMDMAQMYGDFDYTDIHNFANELADEDNLRNLKNMYRRWRHAAERDDDAKMEILAKETANIIKKPLTDDLDHTRPESESHVLGPEYDDDIDDYYANF